MEQFNNFVKQWKEGGVVVEKFASNEGCPDAVWPNNWIVTLNEGNSKYQTPNLLNNY